MFTKYHLLCLTLSHSQTLVLSNTTMRIIQSPNLISLTDTFVLDLPAGHLIGTPEVLIRQIETAEIDELKKRHGAAPKV